MTEKKLSKNQKYEANKKAQGYDKLTLWVPKDAKADFQLMADYCSSNPTCTPFMVRDATTGRMRKAV